MVLTKVSAESLAAAFLNGKKSGCARVSDIGLTSHGRPVRFIEIPKGRGRVTLTGTLNLRTPIKWVESFDRNAVEIDD